MREAITLNKSDVLCWINNAVVNNERKKLETLKWRYRRDVTITEARDAAEYVDLYRVRGGDVIVA